MPLCTQSDVEMFGSVDFTSEPDAAVALWIAAATAAIERYVNRPLTKPASPIVEKFTGLGFHTIRTNYYPIDTVDSITEDAVALIDVDDYFVDQASGVIRRVSNNYPRAWTHTGRLEGIVVTYVAGYEDGDPTNDIPADLRQACAMAVGDIFRAGQRWAVSQGANRVTIDDVGSLDYGSGQAGDSPSVSRFAADLGPEVRHLLAPYVRYHAGVGGRIA